MNSRTAVRSFAGFVSALVAFNFAVGLFVTPQRWAQPPRPIAEDGPENPFRLYRQFSEGISAASFNDSGASFTADFVPGAPLVAIVGDSHILARNVNDGEVMGAVVSRLSRDAGTPFNVRQLGSSGASIVDIAVAGPALVERWNPRYVFAVLSSHTLDRNLIRDYQTLITPEMSGRLRITPTPRNPDSVSRRVYWRFRSSSALTELLCNNPANLLRMMWEYRSEAPEDVDPDPAVPELAVKRALSALRQVFGEKLVVVYHPVVAVTGSESAGRAEAALANECVAEGIPFLSLRNAMVTERDQRNLVSNGFLNRLPGTGHLNATGHRVAGTAIWAYVSRTGHPGSEPTR